MRKIRLGILGSGQLGQMMAYEAFLHGISVSCYSPDYESPMKEIGVPITVGSFDDTEAILKFISNIDILTFEFENIPRSTLDFLDSLLPSNVNKRETNDKFKIFPNPNSLRIAQDRFLEKNHFKSLGLKTPEFALLTKESSNSLIPFPWIIKTLRFGYDGKGQHKISTDQEFKDFLKEAFPNGNEEYLIEQKINFDLEVSVILTRFQNGVIETYGAIENIHKNHILDISIFPARISDALQKKAIEIAKSLSDSLNYVGTIGVEFFIKDEEIFLNEYAPRPHNSGHFSQDSGNPSQFKMHIAAVTDLFRPSLERVSPTVMKNILGDSFEDSLNRVNKLLSDRRYNLHLYGKKESRNGRKMGHLNFSGSIDEIDPEIFKI